MRRGDIHLVDFEPSRGSQVNKRRPAIVVSNDAANTYAERLGRGVLTFVPLTSHIRHIYPFQVLIPAERSGLPRDSKAQAEQVRAVDVDRVGPRVGLVPLQLMASVDEALRIHLDLG
jgi:mRNA interferase MazF